MQPRIALPEDAEALCTLMRRLQQQTPFVLPTRAELPTQEAQARQLAQMQAENWQRIFVLPAATELAGFLGVTRHRAHKVRHVAHLAMALLTPYRRRGLGTALLQAAQDWVRAAGVRRLELTVVTTNAPAIALYERFGFLREGCKRQSFCSEGGDHDEYLMAKRW